MSFHNRINERGAFRQHLNRAQNFVPRALPIEEEGNDKKTSIVPTTNVIIPVAEKSVVTAKPAVTTPAARPVVTSSSAAVTTTGRQFPVPKGSAPFGTLESIATPAASTSSATPAAASATPVSTQSASHAISSSGVASASPSTKAIDDVAASATSLLPATTTSSPVVDKGSNGGLSSGAVGAIVALVILAVVGVGAFFARKFYRRRREVKRNTWGAGLVPALENKRSTLYGNNTGYGSEPKPLMAAIPPSPAPIQVPSALYNSGPVPPLPFVPPTIQSPTVTSPASAAEVAVVTRTFVPNLPDELHITTGEHIRVLNAYDDGWAMCANIRNEQGVVPLECLQRDGRRSQTEMQLQPESAYGYDSNRASKRLSSLTPNATGTY